MKFVSVRSTVYGIGPTMMLERSSSAADAGCADPDPDLDPDSPDFDPVSRRQATPDPDDGPESDPDSCPDSRPAGSGLRR